MKKKKTEHEMKEISDLESGYDNIPRLKLPLHVGEQPKEVIATQL